ncbi:hypothetical protein KP004_05690 [Geomonas oryzisoli]|uniref:Restriction endonuclease n=1 Tax=Geomonas oryzisoli TaxID=2847992 RepID=A0ABX8J9I5_9BACT|nr:hypothetical protein [Geomonas oryzisoli]QWV94671.1 hypothetical protein KP004_05690 [Geomonas oryzisoli]
MTNDQEKNSRARSRTWPYPRHADFEKSLRETAKAWFTSKGYPKHDKYPYCLDTYDNWHHNIIDQKVVTFIKSDRLERKGNKGFPLHKYVHHGLSSQALLFNLLGPLVVDNNLDPLRKVLESHGVIWPGEDAEGKFEYENRDIFNEDSGQPTSIDFMIQDSAGEPKIFIESKLVEKEFGACSVFKNGDCEGRSPVGDFHQCYLHHIGRKYWTLLEKNGFLDGPLGSEKTCIFASHYQFFREVLFALEMSGTFVLLSDERSPTFFCTSKDEKIKRGLMPFLCDLVPEKLRHRIVSITIQEVVHAIEETGTSEWVKDFKVKYGLKR